LRLGVVLAIAACGTPPALAPRPGDNRACALPAPTVLLHEGAVVFERFELPADGPWFEERLPEDAKYAAYRAAIREVGAELRRPIADPPVATTDEQRENWRREHVNADLAAPHIRPIRCLEAALFARQHARFDELTHPTELSAVVLRKDAALRVYLGASDQLFPPKKVYGIDEARRDLREGWRAHAHMHNHTIVKRDGKPALGSPSPSINDVHLLRNVREDVPFERVWVTNGVFTVDIPGSDLDRYEVP